MTRAERIAELQADLGPGEAALLGGFSHRVLYLDFPSSAGTILLTGQGRYFVVDFRYIEAARRMENGFQVLLQEDLGEQLQKLLTQDGAETVFLDEYAVDVETLEQTRELLGKGVEVSASRALAERVKKQRECQTVEEEAQARQGEAIGQRVLVRLERYLAPGIPLRELRQRLMVLRSLEGDESRTLEASFSDDNRESLADRDVLKPGCRLEVSFAVKRGEISVPVQGSLRVPDAPAPFGVGARVKYLRELIPGRGKAALLTCRPDMRWYLGRDPGPKTTLLVTESGNYLLGGAGEPIPGVSFLPAGPEELARLMVTETIKELAVQRSLPVRDYRALEQALPCALTADGAMEEKIYDRRRVKLSEELQRIRQAQDITDRVFLEALNFIREGMTDVEIQRVVGELFFQMGSEMLSYNHVSGCGPDTSLPHVRPSGRTARRGDFVMLDVGAQVDGYGSDMTRMVGIGQVDEEKRKIYELVRNAQNAAIEAARCGAICSKVDGTARGIIAEQGYGEYFLHGLGHPIGCGGREGPRFNQTDGSALTSGLVMTVEPGIYLPGKFGVRIEDMVYIGETGTENLTHSTKELICV